MEGTQETHDPARHRYAGAASTHADFNRSSLYTGHRTAGNTAGRIERLGKEEERGRKENREQRAESSHQTPVLTATHGLYP